MEFMRQLIFAILSGCTIVVVNGIGDLGELLIVSRLLGGGLGGGRQFGCHQARQTATGPGGIDAQPNTLNEVGFIDPNSPHSPYPGDARAVVLSRQEPMPIKQATDTLIPGLYDASSVERQDPNTIAKLIEQSNAASGGDVGYITAPNKASFSSSSNTATSAGNSPVATFASYLEAPADNTWAHTVSTPSSKRKHGTASTPSPAIKRAEWTTIPVKPSKPIVKVAAVYIPPELKTVVPPTTKSSSVLEKGKSGKTLTRFNQQATVSDGNRSADKSDQAASAEGDTHGRGTVRSLPEKKKVAINSSTASGVDTASFWTFRRRKRQIIWGGGDSGAVEAFPNKF